MGCFRLNSEWRFQTAVGTYFISLDQHPPTNCHPFSARPVTTINHHLLEDGTYPPFFFFDNKCYNRWIANKFNDSPLEDRVFSSTNQWQFSGSMLVFQGVMISMSSMLDIPMSMAFSDGAE